MMLPLIFLIVYYHVFFLFAERNNPQSQESENSQRFWLFDACADYREDRRNAGKVWVPYLEVTTINNRANNPITLF